MTRKTQSEILKMLKYIVSIVLLLLAHKALSFKYKEESEETIWVERDSTLVCSTTSTKGKQCMWIRANRTEIDTLIATDGPKSPEFEFAYDYEDNPKDGNCSLRFTDYYNNYEGNYICYIEPGVKRKFYKVTHKEKGIQIDYENDILSNGETIRVNEDSVNVTLGCEPGRAIYGTKIEWIVKPVRAPDASHSLSYHEYGQNTRSFLNFQCESSVVSSVELTCYVHQKMFLNNISDPLVAQNVTLICPYKTNRVTAKATHDHWFFCEADGSPLANQFQWHQTSEDGENWYEFSSKQKAFDLRTGKFICVARNSKDGNWIKSNILTID